MIVNCVYLRGDSSPGGLWVFDMWLSIGSLLWEGLAWTRNDTRKVCCWCCVENSGLLGGMVGWVMERTVIGILCQFEWDMHGGEVDWQAGTSLWVVVL